MIFTTPQEFAAYLTDGFYRDWGYPARQFNVTAGDSLTVNLTALPAFAVGIARLALDSWSVASGLRFVETGSTAADLMLRQDAPGETGLYAHAQVTQSYDDYSITQSVVHVSSGWASTYGAEIDSYYMQTWVHEIGHALGLGHAGLYNGSASFTTDAKFQQDSWHATVMSYFSQDANTHERASYGFAITPRVVDVLAIQSLYGTAPVDLHNTVYGWNANAPGLFGNISQMIRNSGSFDPFALTLTDHGGRDRLDLSGDARDQRIDLRQGKDSDLLGQRGNISIAFGTEIEDASAGSGDDHVTGNYLANQLSGGMGDDWLTGLGANDDLRGGAGADSLFGDNGNDRLLGEAGNDHLTGGDGSDWIVGGAGADVISGENGDDTMSGGDDDDRLLGHGGHDVAHGNNGDDSLHGASGDDLLTGGAGRDTLLGAAGADTLAGGPDDDLINGHSGNDRLVGNVGNDLLLGGVGDDLLTGGAGDDTLRGGAGDDLMRGSSGQNLLDGGNDDDVIVGGTGADHIIAGAGKDRLIGGNGADTFVFSHAIDSPFDGDRDRISDFRPGVDRIDLSAMRTTYLGDADFSANGGPELIHYQRVNTVSVVTDMDGDGRGDFLLLLTGVLTLGADDFIL